MRVNMLRLRLMMDRQARVKKISPVQRTTGVANANSIHFEIRFGSIDSNSKPGNIGAIAIRTTGTVKTTAIQNFRESDRVSLSSSAPTATIFGSSDIPHFG